MTDRHAVALIAVLAAVTALLRFAPFLLFSRGDAPPVIRRLGMLLPGATMAMLVEPSSTRRDSDSCNLRT